MSNPEIIHRSFYKLDCEQKDKIRKENPDSIVIFKTSDTVVELDEHGKPVNWYIDDNDDKITYEERRGWYYIVSGHNSAGLESNENILDTFKSAFIEKIFITHAKDVLCLKATQGFFIFYTYGECCSESWIEHISNVDALINSKIIDLYSVGSDGKRYVDCIFNDATEYYDEVEVTKHKHIKMYRHILVTEGGQSCEIEMRNKSNGYYGGSVILYRVNNNETIQKLLNDSKELTEDF